MCLATTPGPSVLGLASMSDPTYLDLATIFGARLGHRLT